MKPKSDLMSLAVRLTKRVSPCILALLPSLAHAIGDRIPNQDAEAIGRGNAFVATADNASDLYYNPAGITQLEGQHIQVGALAYLGIYSEYESPSGQHVHNDASLVAVPQLGYTMSLDNVPLSFGLGVYAPFGLGMKWPDDAPFRDAGLEADLTYITINPVVAWRVLTNLSIAIGPTFNYSNAKLIQGVLVSPYQFKFDGSGWAYGFNAGLLWQPFEQWFFGAKYFSETKFDYGGTATFTPAEPFFPPPGHTTTSLKFPQMVCGGISYRPTPDWNVEVDVDWTDWDVVKNAVISGIATLPLNWESSFFYEAGVTRQLRHGYYASAGYFYCEASTPNYNYTPLVPDTNLHVGSLGIGRKGAHWDWAAAFQLIGGPYRTVSGAANPVVDGRYRLITPTLSVSLGYHF